MDNYVYKNSERITTDYIERINRFHNRLERVNTPVLERYQSSLKPRFSDYLCFIFFDSEKVSRFKEVAKVLEERTSKEAKNE